MFIKMKHAVIAACLLLTVGCYFLNSGPTLTARKTKKTNYWNNFTSYFGSMIPRFSMEKLQHIVDQTEIDNKKTMFVFDISGTLLRYSKTQRPKGRPVKLARKGKDFNYIQNLIDKKKSSKENITIIALTNSNPNDQHAKISTEKRKIGRIKDIEALYGNDFLTKDIKFDKEKFEKLLPPSKRRDKPEFFDGALFTAKRPKGEILKALLLSIEEKQKPEKIIFVENNLSPHILSVRKELRKLKIPYQIMWYCGGKKFKNLRYIQPKAFDDVYDNDDDDESREID